MGDKRPGIIQRCWQWFRKPSHFAIGSILAVGVIAGVVLWGGFNTAMEVANKESFCIGCHEMENTVYQEYMGTIHYTNSSGVRATCSDCHVPKEWGPKMVRKIQASKELYGKLVGKIDTPKKFEEHRFEMASREWARMKDNDSQECRNCHNFEYMDFSTQRTIAASIHSQAEMDGNTCIDCHKGIAHQLPKGHTIENAI
ncbi:NapC/NirT family cytochrome c [Photobacterium minamisatsumaniensis]|uniref:NapC/NirT family cytochrome c n=1 Tax=Photobacterium minamisatsumaniensis TaxID=2910233 RepID=UPI003D0AB04F